jgi:hypothetical protein
MIRSLTTHAIFRTMIADTNDAEYGFLTHPAVSCSRQAGAALLAVLRELRYNARGLAV